jgi:outer membrane protein, heavy metal efflux system
MFTMECDAASAGSLAKRTVQRLTTAFSFTLITACASSVERTTIRDLRNIDAELAAMPDPDLEPGAYEAPEFDGQLSSYLAYAFANSPELRASFEEWRAATYGPQQARRLPDPTLSFGVFVRAVETRVGPQRARLGVMQTFPWPTKLTASGKSAAYRAEAAQRQFEAHALDIAADVARPYWRLWQVERMRHVEEDDIAIVTSLSQQVRARLEVGAADLSDLAQLDLRLSRARDRLIGLDRAEQALSADLVRAVGAPAGTPTPVSDDPPVIGEPAESLASLSRAAADHPRVAAMAAMSASSSERARAARADRFPRFGLGVDWIITGESQMMPAPNDSGKDAVVLMGTVGLPLWQPSYGAAVNEARANEAAFRARALAERNAVMAEAQGHVARVSDDARRAALHETTLIPQAETAFESVVASYAAGRSGVAELLMAESELLHLNHALLDIQVDFAVDLAELERTVGRPVQIREVDHGER